jgi:hypothetical protein
MNFWMNPLRVDKSMNEKAKTQNEINEWINKSKNILQKEKEINFLLLQESSFRLYKPSFGNDKDDLPELHFQLPNSERHYLETPKKVSRWGLIIEAKKTIPNYTKYICRNDLSFLSCNFKLENNDIITIINLYAQTTYYNWENIFHPMKSIIEKNSDHFILLAGDLNASDKFQYKGKANEEYIFEYIKNELNLIDCTEEISLEDRSTMIDPAYNNGRGFQNDYIFINRPYDKDIMTIKICKDEEISVCRNLYDHYPLDYSIKL